MNELQSLPWRSPLDDYERLAQMLFERVQARDEDAAWRFKWEHPRFREKTVTDVDPDALTLDDARLVIAQMHAFDTWAELERFVHAVAADPRIAEFETAVDAVVNGDADALRRMLETNPGLARARSSRRHHCTLLHYLGANGIEGSLQKTPPNAVEIMKILLDAGAEPDALADLYDHKCTTMSMLVSSTHPHAAGLQIALAETLLDYGAALEGPGTNWQSAILTALAFGYRDTAEALAQRGNAVTSLPIAAGLGRIEDARRLLPSADGASRHIALALAAQHGHADVVRLLLDAGEDPNRHNPKGFHAHSTPLHQAVWSNHRHVVRLLVERGARLDIPDKVYQGTPLRWAIYGNRAEIAADLTSAEHDRHPSG